MSYPQDLGENVPLPAPSASIAYGSTTHANIYSNARYTHMHVLCLTPRYWHKSRLLLLLSCSLSSLCWAVNHLLACCHLLSSESSIRTAPWVASARKVRKLCVKLYIWAACARGIRKLCVNPYISIVTPLRTDTQAQPQIRPPLLPATLTQLCASC